MSATNGLLLSCPMLFVLLCDAFRFTGLEAALTAMHSPLTMGTHAAGSGAASGASAFLTSSNATGSARGAGSSKHVKMADGTQPTAPLSATGHRHIVPAIRATKGETEVFHGGKDPIISDVPHAESSATLFGINPKYMDGLKEQYMYLPERNIRLHFVTNAAPVTDPEQQVVVYIHGFPQFWYAWRYPMQHFKDKQIEYAFDLRGFGTSEKPENAADCSVAEHIADLAAVMKHMKKTHPGKQINLVTHDIGAAIGSAFMYQHQSLVDSFVQINGPNPKSIKAMVEHKSLDIFGLMTAPYIGKLLALTANLKKADDNFLKELFMEDKHPKNNNVAHQGPNTFSEADLKVYQKHFTYNDGAKKALKFFQAPGASALEKMKESACASVKSALSCVLKKLPFGSHGENQQQQQPMSLAVPEPAEKHAEKISVRSLILWGKLDTVFTESFARAALNAIVPERGTMMLLGTTSHWVAEDVPDKLIDVLDQFFRGKVLVNGSGKDEVFHGTVEYRGEE